MHIFGRNMCTVSLKSSIPKIIKAKYKRISPKNFEILHMYLLRFYAQRIEMVE